MHPAILKQDELTALALLIYGVYNVTNRIRVEGCPPDAHYDALVQMIREGAKGSNFASAVLKNRWSNIAGDPLPVAGLLLWTKGTAKKRKAAGGK